MFLNIGILISLAICLTIYLALRWGVKGEPLPKNYIIDKNSWGWYIENFTKENGWTMKEFADGTKYFKTRKEALDYLKQNNKSCS